MASSNERRKRDFQSNESGGSVDLSFTMESCVFRSKTKRRTINGIDIRKERKKDAMSKIPQHMSDSKLATPSPSSTGRPCSSMALTKRDLPGSLAVLRGTVRTSLRRHVSSCVLRHKLKKMQDYSLPDKLIMPDNFQRLRRMGEENKTPEGGCASASEGLCQLIRSTPPRSAARRALAVISELASPRGPRTPTSKGKIAPKSKAMHLPGRKNEDSERPENDSDENLDYSADEDWMPEPENFNKSP